MMENQKLLNEGKGNDFNPSVLKSVYIAGIDSCDGSDISVTRIFIKKRHKIVAIEPTYIEKHVYPWLK